MSGAAGGCIALVGSISLFIPLLLGSNLLDFLGSSCSGFRFLGVTLTIIGVIILLFLCYGIVCSIAGGGGADNAEALPIVASPLLLILLGLGIFALAVSSNGGGESIPGRSYKEYHVESYSKWMQNKVHDTYNWEKYYKKVIVKEHVCKKFGKDYRRDSLDKFHKRNLSPYESGCCKPPEECNFNYTSPAVWVKPEIGNYSNVDCNRWDNDPKTLCYDCESCKAALLQDVTYHWFFTGIVLVVILGLPLLIGCVAIITDNISSSKLSVRLLD
ncbi:tetraspanin-7-like [Chenopodium quinoa]|uniref:tetraspanin-7-like n=1 Tax=Chenopodium quinoa TaxID=63459 RepID=UPI000B780912|nr:tetraspanin-7-like [Chenopodium quinoa]